MYIISCFNVYCCLTTYLSKVLLILNIFKSMGDEDIHHIESQNRGLQVQTANQKALLSELDRLIVSYKIGLSYCNFLMSDLFLFN